MILLWAEVIGTDSRGGGRAGFKSHGGRETIIALEAVDRAKAALSRCEGNQRLFSALRASLGTHLADLRRFCVKEGPMSRVA